MKYPDWFDAAPLFMSNDPEFCLISYYSLPEEDGSCEANITNSKLIADFNDVEYWELIGSYKPFSIFWNYDTQTVLVSDWEVAWETEKLSLLDINKWELYEVLAEIAQKMIDSLLATLPVEGQQQLQLSHV